MTKQNAKFACALGCMDGRSILAVDTYMKKRYVVDYVDQPTRAGMVKILADGFPLAEIESLKQHVAISLHKHGATVIAVAGHEDCAGNPVSLEKHLEHTRRAVQEVMSWRFDVPVIGLFVRPSDGDEWVVEVVE